MKALITGVLGQDGAYLAQYLLKQGYDVVGLIRRYSQLNTQNLDYLGITDAVQLIEGDLTDSHSISGALYDHRPDEIYNLAAQSMVPTSWDQPGYTFQTNAIGILSLLEAIRDKDIRLYQASTSEMFGNSHVNGLQDEDTPMLPRSPYGVAKLAAHHLVSIYREKYDLFAVCGILFNHESPLRGSQFVTQKIAEGVARIKKGKEQHIYLGNLTPRRDWGFAGDYVIAMHKMLQQPDPKDYVIGTGENHSVEDFLTLAFKAIGIDDWRPYVKEDHRYMRTNEVFDLIADPSRAYKELNWKPATPFNKLVDMMVDAAIKRI